MRRGDQVVVLATGVRGSVKGRTGEHVTVQIITRGSRCDLLVTAVFAEMDLSILPS